MHYITFWMYYALCIYSIGLPLNKTFDINKNSFCLLHNYNKCPFSNTVTSLWLLTNLYGINEDAWAWSSSAGMGPFSWKKCQKIIITISADKRPRCWKINQEKVLFVAPKQGILNLQYYRNLLWVFKTQAIELD